MPTIVAVVESEQALGAVDYLHESCTGFIWTSNRNMEPVLVVSVSMLALFSIAI